LVLQTGNRLCQHQLLGEGLTGRNQSCCAYELIDRAGQGIATSAQPTFDAEIPPAEKLAEVMRNHVRQLSTNVDVFRIQFSELFKLTSDRADMLRRDICRMILASDFSRRSTAIRFGR
jgi:hypothetical protein